MDFSLLAIGSRVNKQLERQPLRLLRPIRHQQFHCSWGLPESCRDGGYTMPIMDRVQRRPVVMLPGGVLPAELAYKDLIQQLGPQTHVVAKELEIYSTLTPPEDFTL